jgi:hypothetical protein
VLIIEHLSLDVALDSGNRLPLLLVVGQAFLCARYLALLTAEAIVLGFEVEC